MNKRLLLSIVLALAALLLAACGEPALQANVTHEAGAEHTQAEGSTEEPASGETAAAETPAEEATVEATPADVTPVEETPTEETPTEAATVAETPAEATAVEATPAEAATTETTSAEATPVPGDPTHGETLFTTLQSEVGFACATCHRVDSEEQLIGPGLLNISLKGGDFVEGLDAYAYITQSITDPGAFVVPGFPDNLMPRTYSDLFSEQDITDIIAYLYTLTG